MDLEFDRELFSRVWQRVEGGTEHHSRDAEPAAAALERFMDDEAAQLNLWRALYRVTGKGAGKRLFAELYNEDMRHLRKLRAAYFMKTGKSYAPQQSATASLSPLEMVRRGHAAAQKAQKAYLNAAEGADASLLHSLEREEETHIRRLEAFIEKML